MHAPPEALVNAQVRYFAGVTEDEAVVALPACLPAMRVKRMSIWTLDSNVAIVKVFDFLSVFHLLYLLLQKSDAVVLLLLKVVGYLAVFAVHSCFGAGL
jgi:hypothetical protein